MMASNGAGRRRGARGGVHFSFRSFWKTIIIISSFFHHCEAALQSTAPRCSVPGPRTQIRVPYILQKRQPYSQTPGGASPEMSVAMRMRTLLPLLALVTAQADELAHISCDASLQDTPCQTPCVRTGESVCPQHVSQSLLSPSLAGALRN